MKDEVPAGPAGGRRARATASVVALLTLLLLPAGLAVTPSASADTQSIAAHGTTARNTDHVVVTTRADDRSGATRREKDRTHLVLRIRHVRHGYWVFTGTLTRQGHPYAHQPVRAQVLWHGHWRNVKTKMTDRAGVAHFNARPEPQAARFHLRLYFPGSDDAKPAASRHFRLYP